MFYATVVINLITIAICAYWWRLGGDGQSLFRNPGVPILLALVKYGTLCLFDGLTWWNLLALLYIPALWGMVQAFSYGISAPPHKFWVWVFGKGGDGNYKPVEVLTRATCGFFWSLPAGIFAFLSGGWITFGVYVVCLTIANGLIGGLVEDVEVSEPAVGACVSSSLFV